MIRMLAVFLVAVMPGAGMAGTYTVQSGDHPGFTRLVFIADGVPEWVLGRVEQGYELRADDPSAQFQVDGIFGRISRERLVKVEDRGAGRLFLGVKCECRLTTFDIPEGFVIDIRDGKPPVDSPFEQVLPPPETPSFAERNPTPEAKQPTEAPTVLRADFTPPSPAPTVPSIPENAEPIGELFERYPAPRTSHAWSGTFALDMATPGSHKAPTPAAEASALSEEDRIEVSEMEQDLLLQLGRAASQGLVDADLSPTERRVAAVTEFDEKPKPIPEQAVEPTEPPETAHVRFETAVDRGGRLLPKPQMETDDGTECLADDVVDIASWGDQDSFEYGLSIGPRDFVGEFDIVDPVALEQTVQHYLYLTFGAEAKSTLRAFDVPVKNRDIYEAMATIMDHGVARTAQVGTGQAGCAARVAMWAVLMVPGLQSSQVNKRAVLAAFSELPLHLRRHLGPMLGKRFIEMGDTATANDINSAIQRAPGDHGAPVEMMEAELSVASGKPTEALARFEAIMRRDGPLAPEAVVRLIDESLDNELPMPAGIRQLAEAMAHEAGASEIGAELTRAGLRAQAHEGEILAALESLDSDAELLGPDRVRELKIEFLDLALHHQDNALFVKAVFGKGLGLGKSEQARQLRRDIARRLTELGLTKRARRILADQTPTPNPDERLVFAMSFLKDREPAMAIAYLEGLSGKEAKKLRAQAAAMVGDTPKAASLLEESGDLPAATNLLWREGDWRGVAESGTGPKKKAAELALAGAPAAGGQLAQGSALLERSRTTRAVLSDLLKTVGNP